MPPPGRLGGIFSNINSATSEVKKVDASGYSVKFDIKSKYDVFVGGGWALR
jgi:hypothetical protein